MTTHYGTAQRVPQIPQREEIDKDERAHHDVVMKTWIARSRDPYLIEYFKALAVTPTVFLAVLEACEAVMVREGKPGTISRADHEIIDQVLAIDSGYYGLVPWHTPAAVSEGIRIEALEAMADGREQDLTDDERQQVEFIRAVRDGTMNDDIWNRMRQRLGTERGVVDYVTMVLLLVFHHRYSWAVGVREMPHEDWREMLNEFREGKRELLSSTYTPSRPVEIRAKEGQL